MKLQGEVDELIRALGGYWKPFEMLAALLEETGELAEAMLAIEGVKGRGSRENLVEEIGDVLFALACIANHYGVDLEDALSMTIEKYRLRFDGD
ncbi:MazG nucleotide pyrophosphohydrolase domain-containing protein [Thermococcus sp. AM4]|uniref:MazG nucleotide pyrophosphohydrolase domain-containing protein n=1 Tax=Thermococcus sp. (strain AM4) TaxID=246969 RepID=UPI000187041C|nr:MazG nucleotide pyrophosphohydrolase domain-containing protein [Thermococcus sp. AM4]EEB74604.1 nucleotide pyrophosphohydrolase [Thermococcus sp. AM4]